MESFDKNVSISQTIFDHLPLAVLMLESICGVLCNGAVLLLFCVRKSLLRTASDLFTINLSLVDLIFSGVVLPMVLITAFTAESCDEKPNNTTVIEIARNSVVIFGTVATALGTLLVSLDRGDVSLKPSKRFFTHSKAIIAIGLTWCIATLGIAVAILPNLLSLDKRSRKRVMQNKDFASYIQAKWDNETRIKYIKVEESHNGENCFTCHPCNHLTITSCTIQLIFEIPIFLAAILTIMIIYGKILWSVQRRSRKYIQKTQRPKDHTHCGLGGLNSCCGNRKQLPKQTMNGKSKLKDYNTHDKSEFQIKSNVAGQNTSTLKEKRKTFFGDHGKRKKQDSLEDSLFVSLSNKQDDVPEPNSSTSYTTNNREKSKSNRTDFASVAMSVTVVLAIKRMAARKIKERKKKIRHLRKMTFFIVFTFLFCWTPYYMSKLSIAMSIHITERGTKFYQNYNSNSTNPNSIQLFTKVCNPLWIFNWMLSIAALSCILNPALYIFSREKIRIEFAKTFFPSCSNDAQGGHSHTRFISCLICWDSDDNLNEIHKVARHSVITTGYQEPTSKPNVELQKMATNRYIHEDKTPTSQRTQTKDCRIKAPLIRWETVTCDTPHGSHDELDNCVEENVANNGLLLPPSHSRPRSLSARSVDVLSCSTTIASLAAEF